MKYVSAIIVDFGSTNSGCARIMSFDKNGDLTYTTPEFLHSNGYYAKDETWFFIKPDFFKQIKDNYECLTDEDFQIESRISHVMNPNIMWGRTTIKQHVTKLMQENWIDFSHFKMSLYSGTVMVGETEQLPTTLVIKLFLRILKLDCLYWESRRLENKIKVSDIQWGITIPSIWTDDNKQTMVDIAHEVFSPNTRVLSEPEGPIVSYLYRSGTTNNVSFKNGRISLVVDMGGGTTDICLMKEVLQDDGTYKLEMLADTDGRAAGGNDIDEQYWRFMLRYISRGRKSDDLIEYDHLSDEELRKNIYFPYIQNLKNRLDIEDEWLKTKHSNNDYCKLSFHSSYNRWLKNNGHTSVASVVTQFLLGETIEPDEFYENVYKPTINKIRDKIIEIVSVNRDKYQIDNCIFAGGLSLNESIVESLRIAIEKALGNRSLKVNLSHGSVLAGGSIMDGASYILLNRDTVVRISKRNYYHDLSCYLTLLQKRYEELDCTVKLGELSNLAQEQLEYNKNGEIAYPVFLKGQHIEQDFEISVLPRYPDQKEMNFCFFASDHKMIVYPYGNPDCEKVGEARILLKEDGEYSLKVDFNEGQIANAIRYMIIDKGEIVADGFIKNAID